MNLGNLGIERRRQATRRASDQVKQEVDAYGKIGRLANRNGRRGGLDPRLIRLIQPGGSDHARDTFRLGVRQALQAQLGAGKVDQHVGRLRIIKELRGRSASDDLQAVVLGNQFFNHLPHLPGRSAQQYFQRHGGLTNGAALSIAAVGRPTGRSSFGRLVVWFFGFLVFWFFGFLVFWFFGFLVFWFSTTDIRPQTTDSTRRVHYPFVARGRQVAWLGR